MLPERIEEFSGGELTVPMAWLSAAYIADRLMRAYGLMAPGSVEYRSGCDALATTLFLASPRIELSDLFVAQRRDRWLMLTAEPEEWREWAADQVERVRARHRVAGAMSPDVDMALTAWRWLCDTELLSPTVSAAQDAAQPWNAPPAPMGEDRPQWVAAWYLGVAVGHLALYDF